MTTITFSGTSSDFIGEAFFDDNDEVAVDIVSASSSLLIVNNPLTGYTTTFVGTGFQFGGPPGEEEPTAGTISSFSITDGSGASQGSITGIGWGLVAFANAMDAVSVDNLQPIANLFNSGGPITIDGASAGSALDMDELLGEDIVELITQPMTIAGSNFNDSLFGGSGNDTVNGGAGNDTINGGDGNDNLSGGNQFDTITGGAGNDTAFGGNGRDLIFLNQGNDLFNDNTQGGELGRDTVFAGAGNDTIQGGNGNDEFHGEAGNDLIFGRLGADLIFGGDQFDTIHGGEGNDTVAGGNGRDLIFLNQGNDLFNDNTQGGSSRAECRKPR